MRAPAGGLFLGFAEELRADGKVDPDQIDVLHPGGNIDGFKRTAAVDPDRRRLDGLQACRQAQALNLYTEYGFSSPEELDAAVSAAYAEMQASADEMKPIEAALKEKKELRRQITVYRNTKPVREGLAAQKTKKAQAAYRQEHEADLLRSEAAVRFFKAKGITKFPPTKELTAEIEALMSEKNALYTEYQEKKQRANELLTVKRNIEQVLHGAPSQRRDEHDR